jgi:hypothetical protein
MFYMKFSPFVAILMLLSYSNFCIIPQTFLYGGVMGRRTDHHATILNELQSVIEHADSEIATGIRHRNHRMILDLVKKRGAA